MSNAILTEKIGSFLVITFVRPEFRNPLSVDVIDKLGCVLDSDDAARAERIVFAGTGNVFASGANLREIAGVNGSNAREFAELGQGLMRRIVEAKARTIAAVNGLCYGGALDLALACSMRIGSPDAVFCHPGAGLGIMTGWGGTQRLPRLIGEAAAMEMFLTGEPKDAEWALSRGLIDSIRDDVMTAAINGNHD
ncbi:MAG: enoyl-CoA hydratase/isomerase family protein [Pyrinomonadaceae bacterium]|nr:enoyl-CoA hydratase/isomerase family protein [Pyrinomonadaceae bacterium]